MFEIIITVLIGLAVGYMGYRNATMRQRAMREARRA